MRSSYQLLPDYRKIVVIEKLRLQSSMCVLMLWLGFRQRVWWILQEFWTIPHSSTWRYWMDCPHSIYDPSMVFLGYLWLQKQPPRGVPTKRCSENMQQIYRTPMSKCDFNKAAKQLYWNHTSAWVFSCKFATYFQNTCGQLLLWLDLFDRLII